MPKLIFVIGATATGKTYFIEQNYRRTDVEILNVYDYQRRIYEEEGIGEFVPFGMQFSCLMRVNSMLLDDILEKLTQGRDIVVEQTFYKAKRRIAYIDEVRKIPDVTIEVYVMCPSDAFWKSNIRNRNLEDQFESYKNSAKEIEFPNIAEGMDAIYEVVDGKVKLRMDPPSPEILEVAREELAKECERIRLENEEEKKKSELLESMKERKFWHYCEVCGKREFITAKEAFNDGWDYPPNIGQFGMLGPRTCGVCQIKDTLFWKINASGGLPVVLENNLSQEDLATWHRIKGEPESLLMDED